MSSVGIHKSFFSGLFCHEKKVEVIPVNTTRLKVETLTEYEDCWYCISWGHPFQRKVVRKHLVPVVTVENITKVSLIKKCCSGFTKGDKGCVPSCPGGCGHGSCSHPFTCSCQPGYSGHRCEEEGCAAGSWGQDCSQLCQCQQGGVCNVRDGSCLCPPGYQGAECEQQCHSGTFGDNCSSPCQCQTGHFCHHITGACLRCSNNTFGEVRNVHVTTTVLVILLTLQGLQ